MQGGVGGPRSSPLGNYRQHITLRGRAHGTLYAWATFVLAGVHWLCGSVAALLTTLERPHCPISTPDSGVEMKEFTGILGVLVALTVWQKMGKFTPEPAFEIPPLGGRHLLCHRYGHGLRRIVGRLTVHHAG